MARAAILMPRIRSIHPGFWTDEAVASLSHAARLLFIGLWTQCDDGGVFEWKPLGLKMRIFPADRLNVEVLLNELLRAKLVRRYEVNDRTYGCVKNFLRYQRPKKPNVTFPKPSFINAFVSGSSEPVENQFGKVSADGGDSLEEEGDYPPNARVSPPKKRQAKHSRTNGAQHPKPPRNGMVDLQREITERTHEADTTEQSPPHRGRVVDLTRRLNRR